MTAFSDLSALATAAKTVAGPDEASMAAAAARQGQLTKPPGSLGRLEDLAAWLGGWQRRPVPRLDRVEILVFAGNHGVTAQGVSPYPSSVTAQMVANFSAGGAAINQLAAVAGATLRVIPLSLDMPTEDFTQAPAMNEAAFLNAVCTGYDAVAPGTDLLALGEMGIGNTTSAAVLCAALFGGGGADWAGRGTGVDDAGLARKIDAIDRGLERHRGTFKNPVAAAACLGGRELAAILGATLAARLRNVPVLLDGFVCTAAAAPLFCLAPDGLAHTQLAHVSAEAGHRRVAARLGMTPLFDMGMRLGEGSGAALAVPLLRAAVACLSGMATFAQAGVSDRE